jgi:tRNA/rRNA methyltransferase
VHRVAIELINPDESEAIAKDRAARRAWLEARRYGVVNMQVADIERDLAKELDRLASGLLERH